MRMTSTLAGLMLVAGLGSGSATAAPAAPLADTVAGRSFEHVVASNSNLRYTGRTDRNYRMHRRANTHMHGNPNARNPERPGYKQQLGNTTNGPRY